MELPTRVLQKAVDEVSKLPGIGKSTALRLALHMLHRPTEQTEMLAESLQNLIRDTIYCKSCFQLSESDICKICTESSRKQNQICVVEDITDLLAIERTNSYRGLYHVLGGKIAPIEGIGPDQLRIEELKTRCEKMDDCEIIFALSSSIEGDTTMFYIYKILADLKLNFFTIAKGVGIGDELQYTNSLTLTQSIENKIPYRGV